MIINNNVIIIIIIKEKKGEKYKTSAFLQRHTRNIHLTKRLQCDVSFTSIATLSTMLSPVCPSRSQLSCMAVGQGPHLPLDTHGATRRRKTRCGESDLEATLKRPSFGRVGMTTGKVGMAKMLGSETALEFTKQDAARSPTTVVLVLVGAFFARAKILGECSTVHSPPALLKWRLACAHLFHSLGQDQSTVAQQAETTDRLCPDKLHVSSFPDKFPHYA